MNSLFSPVQIGGRVLENRLVLPPLATSAAGDDGRPTARHTAHYARYRDAGVGLIVIEHTYVCRAGRAGEGQLGLVSDDDLPAWRDLARGVSREGLAAVVQVTHAGGATTTAVSGMVVGPSGVMHPRGSETPQELTRDDLHELVAAFSAASARAVEAGFAGAELHGAHGYLLNQFLSPLTNRRRDEYGGSLEARARFPLEVVAAARRAVGPDALLLYRLGADDLVPGGFSVAEARELARWLVDAGVDAVDISGGMGGYPRSVDTTPLRMGDATVEPMYLLPLASAVGTAVDVPVIYTGGVTDPEVADMLITSGRCDMVGVGRAQLADPEWAVTARSVLQAGAEGGD